MVNKTKKTITDHIRDLIAQLDRLLAPQPPKAAPVPVPVRVREDRRLR